MAPSALQFVNFINSAGDPIPGLVRVPENLSESGCDNIGEIAALNIAKSFDQQDKKYIDYVFFRRFSDGRSSQIAAYIIDNSDNRLTENELAKLHLQVWIQGYSPLLYVRTESTIDLLSCAKNDYFRSDSGKCKYEPIGNPLNTASEIAEELQKLADGRFWESPKNKKLTNYSKAAHNSLIQAVVHFDKEVCGAKHPVKRHLLILMILIKYLEDRKVFRNKFSFSNYFEDAKNFLDVLKSHDPAIVYRLLKDLEDKFNGDIFKLPTDSNLKLTSDILRELADFTEGRTENGQRNLWKLYSFEYLPVEIISHLYQRFVKKESEKDKEKDKGAIYTPPILAELLLDQVMPYDKLNGKERILDPACGSGVFLVGAFKRLINVWRHNNKWVKPNVEILKETLKSCIFGIELDETAIQLTAFSLNLAICDALQPDVIWNDLKFDKLVGANLIETDFFQIIESQNDKDTIIDDKFDVIIGNPPFKEALTTKYAKSINETASMGEGRGNLPRNQLAYLFLEQIFTLLREKGKCCLIQPSGFLYNSGTQNFRTILFQKHKIETILDFVSIRGFFKAADTKVVAVLAHAQPPPEDHWLKHWTFRRTRSIKENICFELDHYDRYRISQKEAEVDPFVWKINLVGGGRLHSISKRFREMRSLSKFVEDKGWDFGEGFIVGNIEDKERILTGKPFLERNTFDSDDINKIKDKNKFVEYTHFGSKINKDRFSPPLILIKLIQSIPIRFWDDEFIGYRKGIIGIHAPKEEEAKLKSFYNDIIRNKGLYRFFSILNGYRAGTSNATMIDKQDIDALPYPEDLTELEFAYWEEALREDVLNYMTDYVRLGQNSDLLRKAATPEHTQSYADLFVKMLGTIYDNLKAAEVITLKESGLICQPFYFGEKIDFEMDWVKDTNGEQLRNLIYDEKNHSALRNIRIIRYYDKNVLLIIKPDRLRYWIRSTAIRDADETLHDLYKWGF
ncbi:MAG: N-6 DNA methylase [Candidatus Hatepunaea meridiana]|nr:N-6 DNA methylase [Candidatus Hatepunaea meridiana]